MGLKGVNRGPEGSKEEEGAEGIRRELGGDKKCGWVWVKVGPKGSKLDLRVLRGVLARPKGDLKGSRVI